MTRLRAVINKEFSHILRDPTSLTIVLIMPVIMIFIFGYSISFDLNIIQTGIIDYSESEQSRELIKSFRNNNYYALINIRKISKQPIKKGEELLKKGSLKQYIIIPLDFADKIKKDEKANVGIIIDGSDSNVANLVYQYNERIISDFISEFQDINQFLKISTKIYFNPELESSNFFIPGLIAIILVMVSALLTSLSISREKESGSIELIFISPLKSHEIILGKTIPYIIVAFIEELIILFFAIFWFGIPFRGSMIPLFVFSLLYILTGLSIGVLVSTMATSQKAAMFAALLITLLPSVMLSGFIFPLTSFVPILRGISYIVPATYFLRIIRGVILKGAELRHFIFEGLALLGFSAVLITASIIKFTRDRES